MTGSIRWGAFPLAVCLAHLVLSSALSDKNGSARKQQPSPSPVPFAWPWEPTVRRQQPESFNPSKKTLEQYKPDATLLSNFTRRLSSSQYVRGTARSTNVASDRNVFYAWQPSGFAGIDYANEAYSPGTFEGKKIYLCHVDGGFEHRPMGITWVEGPTPATAFQSCYFVFRDPATRVVTTGTFTGRYAVWSVLMNFKTSDGSSVYEWAPKAATMESCRKYNLNANGEDNCPLVVGHYSERSSPMGFSPKRWMCRFTENGITYYGWSDINRVRTANGHIIHQNDACYSWKSNGAERVPHRTTETYELLTFARQFQDNTRTLAPRELACGESCRARANFPQGYFPGMAGSDILEGTMNYAFDVASCCWQCRSTPGCIAYTYHGKGLNWCWLKYTDTFNQLQAPAGQPVPQRYTFGPAPLDPTLAQCPLNSTTGRMRPANFATYSGVVPLEHRATFDTGATCKVAPNGVYNNRDAGLCGLPMAARGATLGECCRICQEFNAMRRAAGTSQRCIGFTFMKGLSQCYLRDRAGCNPALSNSAWDNPSAVTVILDTAGDNLFPAAAAVQSNPATAMPAKSSPARSNPAAASPARSNPAAASPARSNPAAASPANAKPAAASPARSTPAAASPARSTPAAASPARSTPAAASPARSTPAAASPARSTPTAASPARSTPAAASPARSTPAAASPARSNPAAASPANSKPSAASPARSAPAAASPAKASPNFKG